MNLKRDIAYGFIVWLIPFAVGFLSYPIHDTHRALFESVMAITVSATAAFTALIFFKRTVIESDIVGLRIGIVWFFVCILIDAPLFLIGGPMHMTVEEYLADIGATYLIIPVMTFTLAVAYKRTPPPN